MRVGGLRGGRWEWTPRACVNGTRSTSGGPLCRRFIKVHRRWKPPGGGWGAVWGRITWEGESLWDERVEEMGIREGGTFPG